MISDMKISRDKPRILVLADQFNPEWPSLPIVGYKLARALGERVDLTVVTHVRNRGNVEKAGAFPGIVDYVDTEWIAAPMHRIATRLRGGAEVNWSLSTIMAYLPYLAFERAAYGRYKTRLKAGEFDIIHRITPMSPTLPSYMSGKGGVPFVLGPLNGALPWPDAFKAEQTRERENARGLRDLYKHMPYARSTQKNASVVFAAFDHTVSDLAFTDPAKLISCPEIGYDPSIFHARTRRPAFSQAGPYEFLFVGRLVPYKLPEVSIRAFATSDRLRQHKLTIIGDGPEMDRLKAIIRDHDAEHCIRLEGRKTQGEVAEAMRRADAFVFPSIRELGAGVVIEAMACGALLMVTGYGAPGALCAGNRGIVIPIQPLSGLVDAYRAAMIACLEDTEAHTAIAAKGLAFAQTGFTWEARADWTTRVYHAVLNGEDLTRFQDDYRAVL